MQLTLTEVIKVPVISEKSTYLSAVRNSYVFEVDRKASKDVIRQAIEELYKVKVEKVRTVNVPGKPRRTRKGYTTTAQWKKAIVELHPDHKIDLF